MDWFEITEFPNRIFRLREPALGALDGSNIWLVVGDRSSLLIDTGVGVARLSPVVNAIAGNPIICLLTHTHYDHIGGAYEFSDRRLHEAEAKILADPNPQATLWEGWLTRSSFARFPEVDFDFASYSIKPAPPTSLVDDADRIDLGGRRLVIMHTPGHSPGLLSILETETGTLFTSDALYDGPMFFDLPGSHRSRAARSIKRLMGTGARTVHPGHFRSLSGSELQWLGQRTLLAFEA